MLDVRDFKAQNLRGLSPDALAAAAEQMLAHIGEQSKHIGEQSKRIDSQGFCRNRRVLVRSADEV